MLDAVLKHLIKALFCHVRPRDRPIIFHTVKDDSSHPCISERTDLLREFIRRRSCSFKLVKLILPGVTNVECFLDQGCGNSGEGTCAWSFGLCLGLLSDEL